MTCDTIGRDRVGSYFMNYNIENIEDVASELIDDYDSDAEGCKCIKGDWEQLKLSINNAIWMHAPPNLTLKDAEKAACLLISHINKSTNHY